MVALLPILVALAGALIWFLSSNPKLQRVGEISFTIGLFFTVSELAGRTITLIK